MGDRFEARARRAERSGEGDDCRDQGHRGREQGSEREEQDDSRDQQADALANTHLRVGEPAGGLAALANRQRGVANRFAVGLRSDLADLLDVGSGRL